MPTSLINAGGSSNIDRCELFKSLPDDLNPDAAWPLIILFIDFVTKQRKQPFDSLLAERWVEYFEEHQVTKHALAEEKRQWRIMEEVYLEKKKEHEEALAKLQEDEGLLYSAFHHITNFMLSLRDKIKLERTPEEFYDEMGQVVRGEKEMEVMGHWTNLLRRLAGDSSQQSVGRVSSDSGEENEQEESEEEENGPQQLINIFGSDSTPSPTEQGTPERSEPSQDQIPAPSSTSSQVASTSSSHRSTSPSSVASTRSSARRRQIALGKRRQMDNDNEEARVTRASSKRARK